LATVPLPVLTGFLPYLLFLSVTLRWCHLVGITGCLLQRLSAVSCTASPRAD